MRRSSESKQRQSDTPAHGRSRKRNLLLCAEPMHRGDHKALSNRLATTTALSHPYTYSQRRSQRCFPSTMQSSRASGRSAHQKRRRKYARCSTSLRISARSMYSSATALTSSTQALHIFASTSVAMEPWAFLQRRANAVGRGTPFSGEFPWLENCRIQIRQIRGIMTQVGGVVLRRLWIRSLRLGGRN